MDASSNQASEAVDSPQRQDCGGARPPAASEEDSDAGLCDVDFPVADPSASEGEDDGDGRSPSSDAKGADGKGDSRSGVGATLSSAGRVDEEAVLRCLQLSIDAHIKGGEVKAFEPRPPKNEEGTAEPNAGEQKASKEGEWFPAPLPLPSWARNIP